MKSSGFLHLKRLSTWTSLIPAAQSHCGQVASILDREQVTCARGASGGGTRVESGTGGTSMVGSAGRGQAEGRRQGVEMGLRAKWACRPRGPMQGL